MPYETISKGFRTLAQLTLCPAATIAVQVDRPVPLRSFKDSVLQLPRIAGPRSTNHRETMRASLWNNRRDVGASLLLSDEIRTALRGKARSVLQWCHPEMPPKGDAKCGNGTIPDTFRGFLLSVVSDQQIASGSHSHRCQNLNRRCPQEITETSCELGA